MGMGVLSSDQVGIVLEMERRRQIWQAGRYLWNKKLIFLSAEAQNAAPKRKQTTRWRDFIRAHMAVTVGTDFFTVEVQIGAHSGKTFFPASCSPLISSKNSFLEI